MHMPTILMCAAILAYSSSLVGSFSRRLNAACTQKDFIALYTAQRQFWLVNTQRLLRVAKDLQVRFEIRTSLMKELAQSVSP